MNIRRWIDTLRSSLFDRPVCTRKSMPYRNRWWPAMEVLEDRCVPTAVDPPSGLVSWWTADNTAADLEGLNNATLYNGTTYTGGEVAQAFSFDGVDDRALVADAESLRFTTSMSIEGWIRVNSYSTTTQGFILFRGDSRPGLDPYVLTIATNGNLTFTIDGGNGGNDVASVAAPVQVGQLIHVAATLDNATGAMKLYENGAVVAQTVTAVRPFHNLVATMQPAIGIGNANSTYNAPFHGLIDELSVYNRALTAGEVHGIDSAGVYGKIKTSTYIAADFPSVVEGSAGLTNSVTFTIHRVGNLSGQAVVNWTTAAGTATAGTDYIAASGQVVFQDGQSQTSVTVTVMGDNAPESNEHFQLVLSTITPGYAVGMGEATIIDDDIPTTTTLTDNGPNPSILGNSVSFTATVGGGSAINGETVFIEDANNANIVVASPTLTGSTVTFTISNLTVGTHHLFAVYNGDPTHVSSNSSLSPVPQIVNYPGPAPAVASVVVNGGGPAYTDSNGLAVSLAGQNSVVEQILVTFNEAVTLDAGAFTITNDAGSVTVNSGPAPNTLAVNTISTPVASTGSSTTGYTQYIVTFFGAGTTAITNGAGNIVMNGLYVLNTIASKVHANGQTAVTTNHAGFWALYGSAANDNVLSSNIGDGSSEVFVDNFDYSAFKNAFGSESDNLTGPPAYNVALDYDLDGYIANFDYSAFKSNFGADWSF